MTNGVGSPALEGRGPDPVRPLRDRQDRVPRRARALVLQEQLEEPLLVVRHLGDQSPLDAREIRGQKTGLSRVSTEQLDDQEALVRAGGRAQVVDEMNRSRDRGREPDAVVGPVDVVVHRLGHRQHGDPLQMQTPRVRQRPVTADGDQGVEAQPLDDSQHVLGGVEGRTVLGVFATQLTREMLRNLMRQQEPRVEPRTVKNRPTGSVDAVRARAIELHEPELVGFVFTGPQVHQRSPPASQADQLHAARREPPSEGLQDCVQPRHVTPTGENAHPPNGRTHVSNAASRAMRSTTRLE